MDKPIVFGKLTDPNEVQRLSDYLRQLFRNQTNKLTGTGAPSTVPQAIADVYVNTSTGDIYIAKGQSFTTDWVKVN